MRKVAGVGKSRHDAAIGRACRVPSAMVEVQMGVDDNIDLFGPNPSGLESARKLLLRVENVAKLFRKLVADAGFNRNGVLARADNDRVEPEQDAVLVVGWRALLPQGLGDHAEHGSAIEQIVSITKDSQLKVTERSACPHEVAGVGSFCRVHYCASAAGWGFFR